MVKPQLRAFLFFLSCIFKTPQKVSYSTCSSTELCGIYSSHAPRSLTHVFFFFFLCTPLISQHIGAELAVRGLRVGSQGPSNICVKTAPLSESVGITLSGFQPGSFAL